GRMPLMAPEEEHRVVVRFNETDRPFSQGETIIDLFERQVERTPNAIAVRFGERQLSFSELNRRTNPGAPLLRLSGVPGETMVGLLMETSIDMVAGLLGILKAGGTYVPLDPANPLRRLSAMLDDVNVPVILTQEFLAARLPPVTGCLLLLWDDVEEAIADQ